jgi:hypothetical protein
LNDVESITFNRSAGAKRTVRWTGAEAATVLLGAEKASEHLNGVVLMLQDLEEQRKGLEPHSVAFLRSSLESYVADLAPITDDLKAGQSFEVELKRRGHRVKRDASLVPETV